MAGAAALSLAAGVHDLWYLKQLKARRYGSSESVGRKARKGKKHFGRLRSQKYVFSTIYANSISQDEPGGVARSPTTIAFSMNAIDEAAELRA